MRILLLSLGLLLISSIPIGTIGGAFFMREELSMEVVLGGRHQCPPMPLGTQKHNCAQLGDLERRQR